MARLALRFLLPLTIALAIIAYALLPLVDDLTQRWFKKDMDLRSQLIHNTMQDLLLPLVPNQQNKNKIEALFNRAIQDDRLFALGFCSKNEVLLYQTDTFPKEISCSASYFAEYKDTGFLLELPSGPLHIRKLTLGTPDDSHGSLVLMHDMSFVKRRTTQTKHYIFYLFLLIALIVSLLTVAIALLSWKDWVSGIKAIIKGEGVFKPAKTTYSPELAPILKDLKSLIRDFDSEKRILDEAQITWSSETIKGILHNELVGDEILVVSNREPYIHMKKGDKIEIQYPASGLVTALEPIMRACSGTWIAHGSGNADREVTDREGHISVPPNNPAYQIRRVWMSDEEEKGFYYGFSNEGLWPLCHIAHVRPIFRTEDWIQYQKINHRFADVVCEEAKTEDPVILIQDYHFALLPELIRKKLPRATIITFWHIPWPNPEAFGICPWRKEILQGLLSSTIIGFHTRFHCNNFLETVDRFLECRIDKENSTISLGGKLCTVKNYPISIEWPPKWNKVAEDAKHCLLNIRKRHNLEANCFIGVGVDRMDYTKGILERLLSVERMLEIYPDWIGKFCFIQIAAPSRSKIETYRSFERDLLELTERINKRFGNETYKPIILIAEHRNPPEVFEYYRAANVCLVTSLHDGMNLVAKEFVASREDELGVLILSMFTGASSDLQEAFIINPYNIDQCAQAIHSALSMSLEEQRARMRSMRYSIQERNVFRWAGRMLHDAAKIRQRSRLMDRMHDWQFLEPKPT